MTVKKYDCLSAGVVVSDHVCEPIEHLPKAGELILSPAMHLTIGGCAANVAVDLAKLKRKVAVIGRIGNDIFGQHMNAALSEQNVICDHLAVSETAQTAATLIVNVKNEDRRFIHTVGANGEFSGKEITPELIREAKIVYLGGYLLTNSLTQKNVLDVFRTARALGVTTVLDVVTPEQINYWREIKEILPYTDFVLPNEDEGELLTGHSDPILQAQMLHEAGAKTAIVTCGPEGTIVWGEEYQFKTNGFTVPFVDGTGSGDAFDAGFIHGLLEEKSIQECVVYGSALGASCVQSAGATTGVFNHEQLTTFLKDHHLVFSALD